MSAVSFTAIKQLYNSNKNFTIKTGILCYIEQADPLNCCLSHSFFVPLIGVLQMIFDVSDGFSFFSVFISNK